MRKPTLPAPVHLALSRLRNHALKAPKQHILRFTTLPMFTTETYGEFNLRDVMSPEVPDEPAMCEMVFDAWLYPIMTGDGVGLADEELANASSMSMVRYIRQESDLGQRAVRLLYALSKAPGATIAYSKNNAVVTHGDRVFGIVDGVVKSKFCTGYALPCDPNLILDGTHDVRTRDYAFISLYAESRRRKEDGLTRLLTAIYMGHPEAIFSEWVKRYAPVTVPGKATMKRLERILVTQSQKDPIWRIYREVVPRWMKSREFNAKVASMTNRPRHLNEIQQQNVLQRMCEFFHNKKKEEMI